MGTGDLEESSRIDIVSLKFASDEAAGWKFDILEPLFYSQ